MVAETTLAISMTRFLWREAPRTAVSSGNSVGLMNCLQSIDPIVGTKDSNLLPPFYILLEAVTTSTLVVEPSRVAVIERTEQREPTGIPSGWVCDRVRGADTFLQGIFLLPTESLLLKHDGRMRLLTIR